MPRGLPTIGSTRARLLLIGGLLIAAAVGGLGVARLSSGTGAPQPPILVQAAPTQGATPSPEPATPEPTPSPTPTPEPAPPPPPVPYLDTHRVVAYYGHPLTPLMGILGEYIGRIYEQVKNRPLYIVREEINLPARDARTPPQPPANVSL